MFSMMMGNQRMMGVSPIPPDVQMMINCAPTTRELLQRPEARAIIHGLQHGDITKQHIIEQLQVFIYFSILLIIKFQCILFKF